MQVRDLELNYALLEQILTAFLIHRHKKGPF